MLVMRWEVSNIKGKIAQTYCPESYWPEHTTLHHILLRGLEYYNSRREHLGKIRRTELEEEEKEERENKTDTSGEKRTKARHYSSDQKVLTKALRQPRPGESKADLHLQIGKTGLVNIIKVVHSTMRLTFKSISPWVYRLFFLDTSLRCGALLSAHLPFPGALSLSSWKLPLSLLS